VTLPLKDVTRVHVKPRTTAGQRINAIGNGYPYVDWSVIRGLLEQFNDKIRRAGFYQSGKAADSAKQRCNICNASRPFSTPSTWPLLKT
jgi:hypothetical protein